MSISIFSLISLGIVQVLQYLNVLHRDLASWFEIQQKPIRISSKPATFACFSNKTERVISSSRIKCRISFAQSRLQSASTERYDFDWWTFTKKMLIFWAPKIYCNQRLIMVDRFYDLYKVFSKRDFSLKFDDFWDRHLLSSWPNPSHVKRYKIKWLIDQFSIDLELKEFHVHEH